MPFPAKGRKGLFFVMPGMRSNSGITDFYGIRYFAHNYFTTDPLFWQVLNSHILMDR